MNIGSTKIPRAVFIALALVGGLVSDIASMTAQPTSAADTPSGFGSADVPVNWPDDDPEGETIQTETSIRVSPITGTICATYNDGKLAGFSRSTDAGESFVDRGDFPGFLSQEADSSLGWRAVDESFYYVALTGLGSAVWRSSDDCATFTYLGTPNAADRPMTAIDNSPDSLFTGRMYVASKGIIVSWSDNGSTWSSPALASPPAAGDIVDPWPAVDPTTGDVYIAYVNFVPSGLMKIWVIRSMDGGESWAPVAFPLDDAIPPREITASTRCGKNALLGDIFIETAPQLVVDDFGHLHIVYMRDPDGLDNGDVSDVFYRRSTDQGITWDPEHRVNDDATITDQWNPTLSVGPSGTVAVSWYDRRNDPIGNYAFDRYGALSSDNGRTWETNLRLSDASSSVAPTIDLSKPCYHGEYDQMTQDANHVYVVWSDDRNVQYGRFDPDVWFEKISIPWIFVNGFEDGDTGAWSAHAP